MLAVGAKLQTERKPMDSSLYHFHRITM